MAKGKKSGGRDFPPGVSGNPAGGPGLPQDVRDARKLNTAEVTRILTDLIEMSPEAYLAFKPRTKLEDLVMSLMNKATEDGCPTRLNLLFDRIIGKVKDQLEVTTPTPFIVVRQSGDQVVMGAEVKKLEGNK